jgi:hypothetical protein
MAKDYLRRLLTLIAVGMIFAQAGKLFALPPEAAHKLIKEVVYNELQDRVQESFWEYRVDKLIDHQNLTEEQVETRYGRIYRVIAKNGVPLDEAQQEQEDARLDSLLHNPGELQRAKVQYEKDEQRLRRLYAMLPDAFVCDYDGEDGGNIRLRFRPNPAFKAPTYEARIFHGLEGRMSIDPQNKRLVALKGELIDRVRFGYGLLGHINKGGTFAIHRLRVSPSHWRADLIDIHVSGRVVLFKTVNKEQHEVRSEFRAVPGSLTLEQAEAMLKQRAIIAGHTGLN